MTGTHDAGTWEILRQVVIGARDVDKTGHQLREALNLAPGFADPLLEDIGLADETLAVGPQAFLEIVAPLDETVSLARWIRKGGGEGGYALSIQVSNIEPYLERAAAADVRTVADLEAYGHRIVQLHPGDLGLLVELDEIPDADEWFWDETEKEVSLDPWVDDILGVDVSSPDPARTATLWAEVFGKKPVSGATTLDQAGITRRVVRSGGAVDAHCNRSGGVERRVCRRARAECRRRGVPDSPTLSVLHIERQNSGPIARSDRPRIRVMDSSEVLSQTSLEQLPASVAWQLLDEPNCTGALEVSQSLA